MENGALKNELFQPRPEDDFSYLMRYDDDTGRREYPEDLLSDDSDLEIEKN